MIEDGVSMRDLTVLADANDPFRVDTSTGEGRRNGEWLAMQAARLPPERRIHLRGLHYMALGQIRPDGTPHENTEKGWIWLCKSAKAARWLNLVPFDRIVDARNSAPIVREFERPEPTPYLHVGVNVEIPDADDIRPRIGIDGFTGVQPYKLVIFGEKTSLDDVLAPIAERYQADLYLPSGECSDTLLHQLARVGAQDGRRMIVFYFSDCDPSGWQMAVSVARKLQAFKAGLYPDLDFELRPVALTPDQVREHGLPSTPMKDTERRADAWTRAMGVQQTEIDALATLQPDLLGKIARDAINPFFDRSLERRVGDARREWLQAAQTAVEAQMGTDELERIQQEAAARLDDLRDEITAINDALHVDVDPGDLPPIVVPAAQLNGGADGLPLIDSNWTFADQSRRLKGHKAYADVEPVRDR
ncbi:MAG: hypothetical protein WKF42_08050 [Solirubrobacteraceae bacterium]